MRSKLAYLIQLCGSDAPRAVPLLHYVLEGDRITDRGHLLRFLLEQKQEQPELDFKAVTEAGLYHLLSFNNKRAESLRNVYHPVLVFFDHLARLCADGQMPENVYQDDLPQIISKLELIVDASPSVPEGLIQSLENILPSGFGCNRPVFMWMKLYEALTKKIASLNREAAGAGEVFDSRGRYQQVIDLLENKTRNAQWLLYLSLISRRLELVESQAPQSPEKMEELAVVDKKITACRQKILDQHAFKLGRFRVYKANEAISAFYDGTQSYRPLNDADKPRYDQIKNALKADFFSAMHDNQLSNGKILLRSFFIFAILFAPVVWLFRKKYGSIESVETTTNAIETAPEDVPGVTYNKHPGTNGDEIDQSRDRAEKTVPGVLPSLAQQVKMPALDGGNYSVRLFGPRQSIKVARHYLEPDTTFRSYLRRH